MPTDYMHESPENFEREHFQQDAFAYVDYLRRRWRFIAGACAVAVVLAVVAGLLTQKRYTATASIVIDPPAGNDPRTATAMSPVYIESLKSYERFADSDTLFARVAQELRLSSIVHSRSIESLKQQVLKVSKLRDTKILEISATLPDPELAQRLANYVAEETVNTSRAQSLAADRDLTAETEQQAAETQKRLERAQAVWADYSAREPVESLDSEIGSQVELDAKIRQQLVEAQSDIADYQERAKQPDDQYSLYARGQLPGLRARAATLEKQAAEIEHNIEQKSAMSSRRKAERQKLDSELKSAQTANESIVQRLRELRVTAGTRAERLRVIDPGIVPQRPSSPNIPLNVIAAFLLGLAASVVYLSLSFSYRRAQGMQPAMQEPSAKPETPSARQEAAISSRRRAG